MHLAARDGHAHVVKALLAAGADAHARDLGGWTPLADAAFSAGCKQPSPAAYGGHAACIAALLAAGASAVSAGASTSGWLPLHAAAAGGVPAIVRLVLAAAPGVALPPDGEGRTPLVVALEEQRLDSRSTPEQFAEVARCLLAEAPLQPAAEVLPHLVSAAPEVLRACAAALAACQPLTAAQWAALPQGSPGLAALLPAVLQRSSAEAGWLVSRLGRNDRRRLRAASLCLEHALQLQGAHLPQPVWRILALSAACCGSHAVLRS